MAEKTSRPSYTAMQVRTTRARRSEAKEAWAVLLCHLMANREQLTSLRKAHKIDDLVRGICSSPNLIDDVLDRPDAAE